MKNKLKILVIFMILFLSIGIVSASQDNDTADDLSVQDESPVLNDNLTKNTTITVNPTDVYTWGSIDIYLKDNDSNPIANQELMTIIDNHNQTLNTSSDGKISLKTGYGMYFLETRA